MSELQWPAVLIGAFILIALVWRPDLMWVPALVAYVLPMGSSLGKHVALAVGLGGSPGRQAIASAMGSLTVGATFVWLALTWFRLRASRSRG